MRLNKQSLQKIIKYGPELLSKEARNSGIAIYYPAIPITAPTPICIKYIQFASILANSYVQQLKNYNK
jgi:hypothetical protein